PRRRGGASHRPGHCVPDAPRRAPTGRPARRLQERADPHSGVEPRQLPEGAGRGRDRAPRGGGVSWFRRTPTGLVPAGYGPADDPTGSIFDPGGGPELLTTFRGRAKLPEGLPLGFGVLCADCAWRDPCETCPRTKIALDGGSVLPATSAVEG